MMCSMLHRSWNIFIDLSKRHYQTTQSTNQPVQHRGVGTPARPVALLKREVWCSPKPPKFLCINGAMVQLLATYVEHSKINICWHLHFNSQIFLSAIISLSTMYSSIINLFKDYIIRQSGVLLFNIPQLSNNQLGNINI